MDIYTFFEAVEILCWKVYKDSETLEDALNLFVEAAIAEYEKTAAAS
jgi:hypothetical protein